MAKTLIIEVSHGGGCEVWIYSGRIQRDIDKAIDLDEGLIAHRKVSCIDAVKRMVEEEDYK
jgi:hypothetical protein